MPPRKRKPGRPTLPKSERGSTVNVSITAVIREYLATVDPSPSRAARLVLDRAANEVRRPAIEKFADLAQKDDEIEGFSDAEIAEQIKPYLGHLLSVPVFQ